MQIGRGKTNKSGKLNNGFSTEETNQKIIVKVEARWHGRGGATFIGRSSCNTCLLQFPLIKGGEILQFPILPIMETAMCYGLQMVAQKTAPELAPARAEIRSGAMEERFKALICCIRLRNDKF